MPIYEYKCEGCGSQFERMQRVSDPILRVCPECGEERVRKLISQTSFQLKGSGWYITDYARAGKKEEKGTAPASSGEGADPAAPATAADSQSDSSAGKTDSSTGKTDSSAGKTDSSPQSPGGAAAGAQKGSSSRAAGATP